MMTRGVGGFLRAVIAVVGLASLAACSSSNSSGGTNPPPPPPNSSGPVEIFPGTVSVPLNGQVHFSAFLPGSPSAQFTWTVSGTATGSINANGIYVAPATLPNPATATITATASGTSTVGTATINIGAAQSLAISPAGIAVSAGGTQLFAATVGGAAVTPTWQVNGTTGGDGAHGTITANGLYAAPLTPPTGGTTVITAISGANSGTATVAVVYSNNSLNGPYAFSYNGTDSAGPLAVAGRFVANSTAGTLAGLEDYNSLKLKTPAQAAAITGTFTVNPDGTGSVTVNDAPIGGNDTWRFALTPGAQGSSSQQALLVRYDTAATGSGSMYQQTTAQLTLSSFTGNYVFGLHGFDPSGKPLHIVGKFKADGLGNLPLNFAVEDINDGGSLNTASAPDATLRGTFFLDPANPGTGRGSLQLINTSTQFPGTFNFTFYLVSGSQIVLIENDVNAFLAGSCFGAPNTNGSFANSLLNGNYVFTLSGATAGNQALAAGGIFASGGAGAISGGVMDRNTGGSISLAQVVTASSYTVDPNFGRVSITLLMGGSSFVYAAYGASDGPFQIVGLDTTSSYSGQLFPQRSTGPVSGSFALNLAAVTNGAKVFAGENVLGGVQESSALGSLSGSLDLNNAGTLTSATALNSTSAVVATDANGRGTASAVTNSASLGFAYYTVDANTVAVLGVNSTGVSVGVEARQF